MRRAAGSHIRTNRQKLALLQRTTLEARNIAPSLRSNHVRKILKREQAQKPAEQTHVPPHFSLVVDRPPTTRHTPRRRSLPKEESPRSGLKPHDTLGVDDRRQSACSIAERRIEEHRKYSSYGVESPIPIGISGGEEVPERSPSISYTRQPVRSLSAGWKESFRRKLNIFRRPSPSSLSSRSTQQFLSPSPEMSCKSNPEAVKMKKSISFSETTRNALRRSFRQKVCYLFAFKVISLSVL
ncbi:hypothetical protein GCK72_024151 [Caenorhabditis remanei]|uniref:Uncharacterized protein n=1 Tax=Caenorhabditis remanei TaxID=31234 RepID=E3LES9_CAERE|nr:hypothetical protein GCK72_024151 [Caenorhabditis remanei]EFO82382.1 hypothetical protein CRE_00868 [Caenorhabditis remanei]KAF1747685.1 hypothetical protein GCK72_024151 [Caenorhabditis remanei]